MQKSNPKKVKGLQDRDMSLTYSRKSIYPFGYLVPRELVTCIGAEMVAVLDNQVIRITIVVCRLAFHKLPNLERIQACCSHKDSLPKLETRALSRVDFEDPTCWVIMGSEGIFHAVNCKSTEHNQNSFAKLSLASNIKQFNWKHETTYPTNFE